jgi:tetratricopeptide (TPR) repeat protein
LARDALVIQEAYGVALRNYFDTEEIVRHPAFGAASAEARRRYLAETHFLSVPLPLTVSGRFNITLTDTTGARHPLEVFAHAADLNQVFYEPALLHGVDYFVRSSGVSARYVRDPQRYAAQIQLYDLLETYAETAARFAPRRDISGPTVTIYRLGTRFREFLGEHRASLDPYWWAAAVPLKYRLEAEHALAPERQASGAVRKPNGRPAAWVMPLTPLFNRQIAPFLLRTAHFTHELGRYRVAARLAGCILAMTPESVLANLIYARSQEKIDRTDIAIAVLENGIRARRTSGLPAAKLRWELALILERTGEREAARSELARLLTEEPETELAVKARDLLAGW